MTHRPFDVICMGRAAVDLYGEQIGGRLEDMQSFRKYLGGSPANTAVGGARLGLRPAMFTRVGDEHNGRFVRETLAAEGVDVHLVATDPKRLTALVFLGIQDTDTFPLVFYRDNCADMAIDEADISLEDLSSATALLVSGTHLSQPQPYRACRSAIRLAKLAGTRVVLDIDYRPVLWGLTSPGMGEQRFVPSTQVSAHLQTVLADCDLVVGTQEEIHIAGGSDDTLTALRRLRELTDATLVLKRGPMGCVVFDGAIPDDIEQGLRGAGFPVEVFNVLGAGDAFMAGFLRGWLRDEPLQRCCTWANACGALVVSRHGCAPAMASWDELQHFLAQGSPKHRLREDEALEHLHRASTRTRHWDQLGILAFDHRVQFDELTEQYGAEPGRTEAFKRLVADAARQVARECDAALGTSGSTSGGTRGGLRTGMILDSRFGEHTLPRLTGHGWWVARPVELPGSRPLAFEPADALMLELRRWPAEHVAKCLVSWHPDDPPALRAEQLARLHELQAACIATDHEFLVEVIPPRELPSDDDTLARALDQIYQGGVRPDWWKLPPTDAADAWERIGTVIDRHDRHCRGVLLLGMEASEAVLQRGFEAAATQPWCRGFAVGRSIFGDAATAWFAGQMNDQQVIEQVSQRYARLIRLWQDAQQARTADTDRSDSSLHYFTRTAT